MNPYEDEMLELAQEQAMTAIGSSSSFPDMRFDLAPALNTFSFAAIGLAYDWHGRVHKEITKDFYRKAADFIVVDLLKVPRRSFLITSSQWRRVRPKFEAIMMSIYDEFEYSPSLGNMLNLGVVENVEFIKEKMRLDVGTLAELAARSEQHENYLYWLAEGAKCAINQYNELSDQEPVVSRIELDDFVFFPVLLEQCFQEVKKRLGG